MCKLLKARRESFATDEFQDRSFLFRINGTCSYRWKFLKFNFCRRRENCWLFLLKEILASVKGTRLSAVTAGTVIRMTNYRVAAPRVGHAEQLFRTF